MGFLTKLFAVSSAFSVLILNASTACAADDGATASESESARFDVFEYRVLGNSVLQNIDIESTLYPLLGPNKTIADVETARAALEKLFHDRGYDTVFVDIPEQDVNEGVVRLKASEGKLGRSRIAGTRYFSNRKIRAALPEAEANRVPHLPTLQAQLAALNAETADRTIVPILKAGARPGTVDLTLDVQDEIPIAASLGLNNDYSSDTSPLRAIAMVGYNDMFGRLDSLSVQYQTSPQERSEVDVWAASYTARLGRTVKLSGFFVDSNSNVATVGDGGSSVNVLGKGNIYGLRFTNAFRSNAAATHIATAGVEYKDFTESIFTKDLVLTPISYVNASLGHTSVWRGEKRQWALTSSANFGLRGRFNEPEEFQLKRYRGVANYFLVRADGAVTQALPWGTSVRLRAAGQYAVDSIVSNEQFSIAGADGVRGYLEAEVLGDIGVKSSFELSSPRSKWFKDGLQAEVFGFFDYGRMSRINPLRDGNAQSPTFGRLLEPVNSTLRSAGAGLNIWFLDHVSGTVAWAYPFVDTPAAGTREGDARVHFGVLANW